MNDRDPGLPPPPGDGPAARHTPEKRPAPARAHARDGARDGRSPADAPAEDPGAARDNGPGAARDNGPGGVPAGASDGAPGHGTEDIPVGAADGGPRGVAPGSRAAGGRSDAGTPRHGPASVDPEEALRRLLRDVVDGVEPSRGSLERLQRAVPSRRRRRKQALVGAAAAVALLGLGAPLLMSTASQIGGGGHGGATVADGHGAFEGGLATDGENGPLDGFPSDGESPLPAGPGGGEPGSGTEPGEDPGAETTGVPSGPGGSLNVISPACGRGQLGQVRTELDPPDAQGRIYGLIRLANVSDETCRVDGTGELAALPAATGQEATSDVQIVDRTEGDRATGLPAPDEAVEELVLPPGGAYEVRFAWVPESSAAASGTCEAAPAGPGPEPSETPPTETADPLAAEGAAPGEPGGDGTTSEDGGGEPSGGGDPTSGGSGGDGSETPADDAVVLRYTPEAGAPEAAEIRLEGTCTGTVYRTGVLEASPA
ncbi:hypothetical protein RM780_16105 [Streptomyces sp. DSM 44917]|uniref:DUF4232 domain-containing protein n=1 Tax=Streptomyces boetiae TaxID=3075541 RepID=A0ABU2LAF0_9ACTN|nr:hypothetical protein [Streptomyces sp. DSM 44917]MDT0308471.1 hypothetical protein [Streptomyces sp. DSM 44917]